MSEQPKPPEDSREQRERRKEIRQRVQYAAMMIVALIAAYGAWTSRGLSSRIGQDEHSTCVIQKRGLPAGHQLADAFKDLNELLTVILALPPASPARPVPKGQRQRLVHIGPTGPTGTTGTAAVLLRGMAVDLNYHLGRYLELEGLQPGTRKCARVGS